MNAVKFEDILARVGDYGKWQITVYMWICILGLFTGISNLSSAFLGAVPNHWCHVVGINTSWTTEQVKQFSIPLEEEDGEVRYSQCRAYDRNYSMLTGSEWFDVEHNDSAKNISTKACNQWLYDDKEYGSTVITKWDLVCEYLPLQTSIQASYMGGVFTGALLSGIASDRFGRKPTMQVCVVAALLCNIAVAFSTTYAMFIAFRFLLACAVAGAFTVGFVLVMEILGPQKRTGLGILYQAPFAVGVIVLPGLAYAIKNWFWLQITITMLSAPLPLYYWVFPESPRWLMTEGRLEEAEKILQAAAKKNGYKNLESKELRYLMESFRKSEMENQPKSVTNRSWSEKIVNVFGEIIVLFRTREMRKRTLIIFYSWMVVSLVYYGISFNAKNVNMDPYMMMFLSGAVEIPAYFGSLPLLNRFGRKKCCCVTFAVGGAACLLILAVPGDLVWLVGTLSMTGKMCLSSTFAIVYVYTAELFPTVVRNQAVGGASMSARIGSIFAPFIVDLLAMYHRSIPSTIFGVCSLTAGLLTLLLPETQGKKLPETVEEVERYRLRNTEENQEEEITFPRAHEEEITLEVYTEKADQRI